MQNQKSPPELPNSWRTGHAQLMSHLIIARTVGPRRQVFLQGVGWLRCCTSFSVDDDVDPSPSVEFSSPLVGVV